MTSSRILLTGRGTLAANCLDILYKEGYAPLCIICDITDNGVDTWIRSLWKAALEKGYTPDVNLFKTRKVNDPHFITMLRNKFGQFHTLFSLQPYSLFRMPFIHLADQVINMHFGPLPKLRGVAPCSWAILDGLDKTGITLHLIQDEGIDNGPIITQTLFHIDETDTAETIFKRCTEEAITLFQTHFDMILTKTYKTTPQNENEATYHPMGELDFELMQIPQDISTDQALRFAKARIFPAKQCPFFLDTKKQKVTILNLRRNDKLKSEMYITKNKTSYVLSYDDGALEVYDWKINNIV